MKKRIIGLVIVLFIGLFVTGCFKNSKMIGQYELKETTSSTGYYTLETLRTDLGREIKIEITEDKVIKTTIYYATDGTVNTSIDEFLYDSKHFNDTEDSTVSFYSYIFDDDVLTIQDLSDGEVSVFIKK